MTLLALIERLEREPDRETWLLVNEFALTNGWIEAFTHRQNCQLIAMSLSPRRPDLLIPVALSWMPEGLAWQVGVEIDLTPTATVWGHDVHVHEFASNPAQALALAILKARMAMDAPVASAQRTKP